MERKGVSYVECKRDDCPFVHLVVDGRAYAEWSHPRQPALSPMTERTYSGWIPKPICRSCRHHFDHHRAYNVYCTGDDGRCRCEHYWAPERAN